MKRVMVRYRVKPERAAENERYIKKVFEELGRIAPPDFRYASFKQPDGESFVHLVSLESEDGRDPLRDLPAFKAFTANILDRCQESPVVAVLTEVGSYRFPGT